MESSKSGGSVNKFREPGFFGEGPARMATGFLDTEVDLWARRVADETQNRFQRTRSNVYKSLVAISLYPDAPKARNDFAVSTPRVPSYRPVPGLHPGQPDPSVEVKANRRSPNIHARPFLFRRTDRPRRFSDSSRALDRDASKRVETPGNAWKRFGGARARSS